MTQPFKSFIFNFRNYIRLSIHTYSSIPDYSEFSLNFLLSLLHISSLKFYFPRFYAFIFPFLLATTTPHWSRCAVSADLNPLFQS
jgi:hypothetical protein